MFRLDTSGTLTTLHAFNGPDGSFPLHLIQGSDGDFYGVTGDALDYGTAKIFKIDAAGTLTTLYRFPYLSSSVLIQGIDGSFYGSWGGVIFRFDPAGTLTPIRTLPFEFPAEALIQASDGSLYGTIAGSRTAPGVGGTYPLQARSGGNIHRPPSFRPQPGPCPPPRTCDRGERRAPLRDHIGRWAV